MATIDKTRLMLLSGGLFGLVAAFALGATAENTELDAGPRVFPYNGILELDGAPVDGAIDIIFTVADQDNACTFEERQDAVPISGGAFSVIIGQPSGGVSACIWDAEEIYLTMSLRPNDDNPRNNLFAPLSGRKRIFPSPFAYWAASADDLKVDGNLVADGISGFTSANIRGGLDTDALTLIGDTAIGGDLSVGGAVSTTNATVSGPATFNNPGDVFGGLEGASTNLTVSGDLTAAALNGTETINSDATAWRTGGAMTVAGGHGGQLTVTNANSTTSIGGTFTTDVNGVTIRVGGNTTIGDSPSDTLSVEGDRGLISRFCRLCLLWADSNGANKGSTCTELSGFGSTPLGLVGDVNGDDLVGLAYLCDGAGSTLDPLSGGVNTWPHE